MFAYCRWEPGTELCLLANDHAETGELASEVEAELDARRDFPVCRRG